MKAKATNKYIGSSPRKMRLVIDLIRGESVDKAIEILHFNPKHAAHDAEKVLRSAVANLFNTEEGSNFDTSDLYVHEVFVNQGPMLKRIQPAPMGRAFRVRKRSNHLTIVVSTKS
ncbi:MAG: 50S ribosomal protein L22 [Chlorobi bacterium]|nr:50S ribosomal protein L22 [Chlorobiota bacterium]